MNIEKPTLYQSNSFDDLRGNLTAFALDKFNLKRLVQANYVFTKPNVVRGMHFQLAPWDQTKIILLLKGKIRDVVVNLQTSQKYVFDLEEGDCLYVPREYAHGFSSKTDSTVLYLLDNDYKPELARFVSPFCSELDIDWGVEKPFANERDHFSNSWSKRFEAVKGL
jgi:dTDP-4-dehydrorhamnose 3,5-epimerase